MSQESEIRKYIKESLALGYSKERIRTNLLLRSYPEKLVEKQLLETTDPGLYTQYKKFNDLLAFFVVVQMALMAFYAFAAATGEGLVSGLLPLAASLVISAMILAGVVKTRVWGYVLGAGYGILNLSVYMFSVLAAFSSEKVTEIAIGWDFITGMAAYFSMAILGYYCWKKIRPDFGLRNLFAA